MTISKLTGNIQPLDEVDKINELVDGVNGSQPLLVSGTNIKTINNNSILGSGNLALDGLPSQTGNAGLYLQTDGTDASWQGVPGRNIGEIVTSTIPLTDAGLHLLDGALISGSGSYSAFVTYIAGLVSDYPDLFETEANWQQSVTDYGVCGKFVYDSVNNTVRLPKITGFIEGASGVSSLGDLTEAGLPNITGTVGEFAISPGTETTGAFSRTKEANARPNNGGNDGFYIIDFDASDSNSIYGNSTTVQPQTIKVLYYIVVATTTKTDIQVDIDEIATDLNNKADIDLTNCTDVANIKMAHNAMPSNTYDDLTLGASGTTYTAPADGYFYVKKTVGSDWYYMQMQILDDNNLSIYEAWDDAYRTSPVALFLPVKKGYKAQISYNATGATNHFRFIYAKGSESEA